METRRPSKDRFYRPELDVVRFIAFSLVFLFHVLPHVPGPRAASALKSFIPIFYALSSACRFGLTLFFTLSAFLICELLIREREAAGTVYVKQFYIRRILRIWPLYYFALALGLLVAFLPGGDRGSAVYIAWSAIFMGGWSSILHGLPNNPMNPLWSISVEEQFYLFAPWAVKYFNRKSLYALCVLLLMVANSLTFYLGKVRSTGDAVWLNSLVQFECFAAGILLCLVLDGKSPRIHGGQRLIPLAGCGLCWFSASYWCRSNFVAANENPGGWHLVFGQGLAALGSVLLLVAFLGMNPKRLPRWVIYLGRISFGLYVYHELALYLLNPLLSETHASFASSTYFIKAGGGYILTIIMASISYRYIETPFLKMKKRHTIIESQPIAEAL
jgi:peptidoglycan/LPS O-acetylase OafA/YrhL